MGDCIASMLYSITIALKLALILVRHDMSSNLSPNIDCIIISPIYISWSCKKKASQFKKVDN